ncbi:MAG: M28 family peptidase, partial [Acidobacteriota bacterium]
MLLLFGTGNSSAEPLRFVEVDPSVIAERFSRIRSGDAKRAKELAALFAEAGCPPEHLVLQKVRRSRHPNVICTLPGSTDQRIIVGAHFDSVPSSPGAVDNWSGAALLPSLYASLSRPQRRYTFVFIGFTDEEEGRIGSLFYVDQLSPSAGEKVRAMVNLDSLGLGATKVWAETADPRLMATLDLVAKATNRPWSPVDLGRGRNTDSTSFGEAGIPA